MRRPISLLAFALGLVLTTFVTVAPVLADGAPPPPTKVVIIVGPTHGATDSYRADADQAYAVAGVPWPVIAGTPDGQPILSGRDRSNPSLVTLVERLRTTP